MSIKQCERIGCPTILGLGAVVLSMMVLALCMTATGTARFMAPMGYDIKVGYGVGATLELAKEVLPVAVIALWARRAGGLVLVLGAAWVCVVTFSSLATHATVMTAISSIERTGTWKMEVRGNAKTELASIEQQLGALSHPSLPRPAKTVQEALAAERVPPSVWQDSQECARIQESAHFARACAQIVQLRRELAAALDYERLSSQASELRKRLAEAPIVATSDPLPAAFNATLGRLLPIGGTEGVALLLTVFLELISSFGLAGLTVLNNDRHDQQRTGAAAGSPIDKTTEPSLDPTQGRLAEVAQIIQFPSALERAEACPPTTANAPPHMPARAPEGQAFGQARTARLLAQGRTEVAVAQLAHGPAQGGVTCSAASAAVSAFVVLLERAGSARATGSQLFRAYAAQRALHGWPELKPNTFGVHLKISVQAIGGRKLKSYGQVYEGVRIPQSWHDQLVQSA
jgi:hypothetical protein